MRRIRVLIALYTNPQYLRAVWKSATSSLRLYFWTKLMRAVLWLVRPSLLPLDVIVPTGVIIIIGVTVSLNSNDWQWFARAGSLLVVVAVIAHGFSIKTKYEKLKPELLRELYKELDVISSIQDDPEPEWSPLPMLQTDFKNAINRATDTDIDEVEKSYKKYELITGVLGTVIWGFGDLLGLLFQ